MRMAQTVAEDAPLPPPGPPRPPTAAGTTPAEAVLSALQRLQASVPPQRWGRELQDQVRRLHKRLEELARPGRHACQAPGTTPSARGGG